MFINFNIKGGWSKRQAIFQRLAKRMTGGVSLERTEKK
jgi:hypothetical protein